MGQGLLVVEHRAEIEDVEIPAAQFAGVMRRPARDAATKSRQSKVARCFDFEPAFAPAARISPTETGVSEQY